jgi:hypothetical protein
MADGNPTVKYYAAKQFYRWIRPGMVHIGSSSSLDDQLRVVSFKNPSTGAMTHVIINKSADAHDATFNLSGSGLPGTYKMFRSQCDGKHRCARKYRGRRELHRQHPGHEHRHAHQYARAHARDPRHCDDEAHAAGR